MIGFLSAACVGFRRRIVVMAVAGLPALLLAACTPAEPFVPEPSLIPYGQGRLWQVDGPGIETSYVFATFRGPDKRVLELPPRAAEAFETAEVLRAQLSAAQPLSNIDRAGVSPERSHSARAGSMEVLFDSIS